MHLCRCGSRKRPMDGIRGKIIGLAVGLIACAVLTCLFGCKTKYVAVPEIHYRDSIQTRIQHDSIHVLDSVYFTEYIKGDTVFRVKNKYSTIYRDRYRTDTVQVIKRDTITKTVTVKQDSAPKHAAWSYPLIGIVALLILAFIVYQIKK